MHNASGLARLRARPEAAPVKIVIELELLLITV
jgi:hypothetical protein